MASEADEMTMEPSHPGEMLRETIIPALGMTIKDVAAHLGVSRAALSEDAAQRHILVADGANMQIMVLDRQTEEKLASFGRPGSMAGEFKWVHNMAIDSNGNLYTSEVGMGRRVQKFKRTSGPTN